jgi:acyl dehydratase
MEVEVIGKSAPRSRPTIGFVKFRTIVYNQRGEAVMRQIASNIQPRHTAGTGAEK